MSDVDHLVIRPGEWRLRWLYTIQGNRLHKIEQVRAISEERTHVDGVSACGHEAVWCMPGFWSRAPYPLAWRPVWRNFGGFATAQQSTRSL